MTDTIVEARAADAAPTSTRSLELGILCLVPVYVVGFGITLGVMGHYLPPPNMVGLSAEQLLSGFYDRYGDQLAYGYVAAAVIGVIYMPWSCLVASKMRNGDGTLSLLAIMQLAGGLMTTWVVMFCPAIWAACAVFRNDVPASVLKMAHAVGWYFFDITFMVTVVQVASFGLYALSNRDQRMFPRWVGYYSLWECFVMFPLAVIPWVSSGPFTVGGLFNWWLGAATWLTWFSLISFLILRSIRAGRQLQI